MMYSAKTADGHNMPIYSYAILHFDHFIVNMQRVKFQSIFGKILARLWQTCGIF